MGMFRFLFVLLCFQHILAAKFIWNKEKFAEESIQAKLNRVKRASAGWSYTDANVLENVNMDGSTDETIIQKLKLDVQGEDVHFEIENDDPQSPPGREITDNFEIKYDFSYETGFRIGKLIVKDGKSLDREDVDTWRMKLSAYVGEERVIDPSPYTVYVLDKNDNDPYLSSESKTQYVSEKANYVDPLFTIIMEDEDKDENAECKATKLDESDDGGIFIVQPDGKVYLKSPNKLNYEERTSYNLWVNIRDMNGFGRDTDAVVEINVMDANDYAPVFLDDPPYTISVSENQAVGDTVLTIRASDADSNINKMVYFVIRSGDNNNEWRIDSEPSSTGISKGLLKINRTLDYETMDAQKRFMLSIQAYNKDQNGVKDTTYTSTTTVTVHVTDANEPPDFINDPYQDNVDEDADVGTVVTTVEAKDFDFNSNQTIEYSMDDNCHQWFGINGKGQIYTTSSLDREELDNIQDLEDPEARETVCKIKVRAKDNYPDKSASGFADVFITINDMNDNPPMVWPPNENNEWLVSMCARERNSTVVDILQAVDPDTGSASLPLKFTLASNVNDNRESTEFWALDTESDTSVALIMNPKAEFDPGVGIELPVYVSDQSVDASNTMTATVKITVCDCAGSVEGASACSQTGFAFLPIIIGIIVAVILILVIILAIVVYKRKQATDDAKGMLLDDEDDVRENLQVYHDEGGGEEDQDAYDITALQQPLEEPRGPRVIDMKPVESAQPQSRIPRNIPGDDIEKYINDAKDIADKDPTAPPFDSLLVFDYEGTGSDAGSLSSLNSGTTDGSQDYDHLNDWGPRFKNLANMYGQGSDTED